MLSRALLIAALLGMFVESADAQYYYRRYGYHRGHRWGGYGGFATTPAESYARGMAAVIRAEGQAYANASQAAINFEQARSAYLKNELLWQKTAEERRRLGTQKREQADAAERAARERHQSMAEHAPQPAKLSSTQFDRSTGLVTWPATLLTERFKKDREQLEELLVTRAHTGESTAMENKIYETARHMQSTLKDQIHELSPHDYIESRKFLDQLAAEVHDM